MESMRKVTEGMVARPYDIFLVEHQGKWFHSDDNESFGGQGYSTKEEAITEGSRLYSQDPETTEFYICLANVASLADIAPLDDFLENTLEGAIEFAGETGGDRFDVELDSIQKMVLCSMIQDYLLSIRPGCLNFFQADHIEAVPLRKLS